MAKYTVLFFGRDQQLVEQQKEHSFFLFSCLPVYITAQITSKYHTNNN